jgi:DNA polymerase-1
LEEATKDLGLKITSLQDGLRNDKVFRTWRRRFGDKAKLGSREQLGKIVFEDLGFPSPGYTARGEEDERYRSDKTAFDHVDLPFLKDWLECEKLKKLKSTYLGGIAREVQNGFIHPSFDLHKVVSYRSSSSAINFQNQPARDPASMRTIRRCFVPRKGRLLVEVDYGQIEVRVASCYTLDPVLIKYVSDPTTDMHRDVAADLFFLPVEYLIEHKDWAKKTVRDWAKNRFVFPQFYGSVFFQCAPHLWQAFGDGQAKLPDGTSILDHLRKNGVSQGLGSKVSDWESGRIATEPGTFMEHICKVEDSFWKDRFTVYTAWKKSFWQRYLRKGYFDLHTGFRCSGLYKRNDVLNYPVQGTAFHCLLWSLIRLQKWLEKKGMRTKLIGQIHDSLLADVPPDELDAFLDKARKVMTEDLPKAWPWLIVPLDVEAEVAETSWAGKVQWVEKDGQWAPKPKG